MFGMFRSYHQAQSNGPKQYFVSVLFLGYYSLDFNCNFVETFNTKSKCAYPWHVPVQPLNTVLAPE